ncbi:MAG: hypothetical protein COT84_03265 [Chlamydiae bacterium CG10_big_fil_rev_8_21_14_0_10_35_9]|nr:MAG: hypothetical protein COT84_03265 [Chlamydiae bacterium CG10_big_fil_rev_8_21_14_0_10_35_9]
MSKQLTCWQCHALLQDQKINFRTICESCFTEQHACLNCRHHCLGKPNDCNIPNTDNINTKDRMNFCDDFSLKQNIPSDSCFKKVKKIFGEELPKKKSFEELFND